MRPPLVRRLLAPVACLAVVAATPSCTGDRRAADDARQSDAAAPVSAPFRVQVTRVAGRLGEQQHSSLAAGVRRTLTAYLDAAFLGGDYPREDFAAAYRPFTSRAVATARRDQGLLTNQRWGSSTKSVRSTRRTAYLSVVASQGDPVGVTANVDLVFLVDRGADPGTRVRLAGQLLLTRDHGRWAIFGYRLNRSDNPVEGPSR